jgi:hypothetical protein
MQSRESPIIKSEPRQTASDLPIQSLQDSSAGLLAYPGRPFKGSQPDDRIHIELVDEPTTAKGRNSMSVAVENRLLHVVQFLQHAARRALDNQTVSQSGVFRSLAPFAIFSWILAVASFLPRKYSGLEREYGAGDLQTLLVVGILGGLGILLLVLRGGIWVAGVFIESFCNADLSSLFQKGEMVDAEGVRMGDADMVLGNLFH